jgi:2-C-methyl-D-erythritol 4-phosphate cytidylyltransferase
LSSDAVIITAAGSSKRWADKIKKEYASLDGRPVLSWALQPFLRITPRLIIVVTLPEVDIPEVRSLLKPLLDIQRIQFTAGGKNRQESVRLGLEALQQQAPRIVLIHDGARPWVDRSLIERVMEGTRKWGACIPVVDASEAPKRIGPSGLILEDVPRDQLKLAQTPQGFLYERIHQAHQQAKNDPRLFVDDAGVYAAYWTAVFTVHGHRRNKKLTFREDLNSP